MQRRTRDNTFPQSQYCGTAPYSLRSKQVQQCTPKTRNGHRAYDTATILHTSRTCRLAPRSPLSSQHAHTRADTHGTRNKTRASWRVSPETAHTNKPRTAHRTLTHSIQHTSPARPHDVPHSRDNCALRKHHCTHTAARTPQTAWHTASRTPHTAHRISHSVTHAASAPHSRQSCQATQCRRDAAGELVVAQPQVPAGHMNSHRVTPLQPTPPPRRPQPAARNAFYRIASHSINQIKSFKCQSENSSWCQRLPNDSTQLPDAVIPPLDKPVTRRRSHKSQRNDSDTMHVQTAGNNNDSTATANSE